MNTYFAPFAATIAAFLCASPCVGQSAPDALDHDYANMLTSGGASQIGLIRNGNEADNRLGGTQLSDGFNGAAGNDMLIGYEGYDTYRFAAGDGLDTIIDHSPSGNKIKFMDIAADTVTIAETPGFMNETDRLIRYGDGDVIRIVGWSRLPADVQSKWDIEHFFRAPPSPEAEEYKSSVNDMITQQLLVMILALALGAALVYGTRSLRK